MEMASSPAASASPSPEWPSIAQFYAGRDVFVTGATGFLGKCLVEKLIRSIPDIGRVMVLVRPKRGKTVQERIDTVLSSKLFDLIRSERPAALEKVVPISGDCWEPGLGIGESDQQLLAENVSIIFHLAATIKFDEPIRDSLKMNVLAVKEMIKLGRKMKKLASFVHVSSAYAHCNRKDQIEEIIYPPKIHPDKVLALLDWMTDDQLNSITHSLLEGRPNTYTYTKSLAEYIITHEAKDLPMAIYRPSIVSGSAKEPYPGWVDCIHGPTGIIVASGKGFLRVIKCDNPNGVADMVPVDLVNNCMVSIGWITALRPSSPQPLIYQYTSGTVNPFTWNELYGFVISAYLKNPFDEMFRRPHILHCRPSSTWKLWHFVFHLIPGFLVDCVRRMQGKKPMMVKLYGKLDKALTELGYFLNNSWKWNNSNSYKLLSLLSPEDQKEFDFDLRKINWNSYFIQYCLGIKRYLFNEDPANLPIARKQMKRFRNIHYTFNFLVFLVATRLLYIRSKIARSLWATFWQVCVIILTKIGLPFLHHSS